MYTADIERISSGVFIARSAMPEKRIPSTMIAAPPAMESAIAVCTVRLTSSCFFAP